MDEKALVARVKGLLATDLSAADEYPAILTYQFVLQIIRELVDEGVLK